MPKDTDKKKQTRGILKSLSEDNPFEINKEEDLDKKEKDKKISKKALDKVFSSFK